MAFDPLFFKADRGNRQRCAHAVSAPRRPDVLIALDGTEYHFCSRKISHCRCCSDPPAIGNGGTEYFHSFLGCLDRGAEP